MNMIERVAIALAMSQNPGNWKVDFSEDQKNLWMVRAKAAIEAMREPTDSQRNNYFKMRKAAGQSDIGACFIDSHWECAIDAALKEE